MFGGTSTMRPIARWLLVGLLVASGNACTTVLAPERTEALGPPFNDALKEGYLQLAGSRWQQGSWEALHFRDKARQAMLGDLVWPDDVAGSRVPAARRVGVADHPDPPRLPQSRRTRSRGRHVQAHRIHRVAARFEQYRVVCRQRDEHGRRVEIALES